MSIASEISRLQTAKGDMKTAIERKGVTVPGTTKLDGYHFLVEQIKTGEWMQYALNFEYVFRNATLPEEFEIDFCGANLSDISNSFYGATCKKLKLKNGTVDGLMTSAFRGMPNLTDLEFVNFILEAATNGYAFRTSNKLERIIGEFDFSNVATNIASMFYGCSALVELRIKPSTLSVSTANGDIDASPNLSDDSLISIANGLDGSATGKTIKLHSTCVTKCSTIMGTNNSGTFEKDTQGTMSLQSFITTVKGWTLA